jgi:hypothetical protein
MSEWDIAAMSREIEGLRKRCHDPANAVAKEYADSERFKADLVGTSGADGKIGALRGSLTTIRSALIAVAVAAAGALGTGVTAVYSAGEEKGGEDFRLEAVEKELEQLKAMWTEVVRLRILNRSEP